MDVIASRRAQAGARLAPAFSYREIAEGHVVLRRCLGQGGMPVDPVELHVIVDPFDGGTVAWWQTAAGTWLTAAHVGAS